MTKWPLLGSMFGLFDPYFSPVTHKVGILMCGQNDIWLNVEALHN